MLSLNRHEVIGHLGADPELTYTPTNRPVAKFSVCTNRRWKDSQGNVREKAQWHRIVVWGQRAEMVAKYLRKGAYVRVVGESETNEYTDREDIKRWSTQINAQSVDFLERRDDATQNLPDAAPEDTAAPAGDDIPL